jgi:hypothetical protein
MFDEEERLRILERVSKGELTPEEGQLQIAMMKVKAQRQEPAVFEPEPQGAQPPRQAPNMGPLLAFMALPIVLVVGFVAIALTLLLAFPVYLGVWLWNAVLVPALPGAPLLAYLPTLGLVVLFMLVSTALNMRFKRFRGGEQ